MEKKASDQIQHLFKIKIFNKKERTYLNIKRPYMTTPQLTSYSMMVKSFPSAIKNKSTHSHLSYST